jgi:hypothetical protein
MYGQTMQNLQILKETVEKLQVIADKFEKTFEEFGKVWTENNQIAQQTSQTNAEILAHMKHIIFMITSAPNSAPNPETIS